MRLRIVTLLLLGYFCMGRSFAYWGIPPWHLFIGEIVLASFLLYGPLSAQQGRWPWLALKNPVLHRYWNCFLVLLGFGIFQVFHGILSGYSALVVLRDLAFNYYPFYFFLGLWAGVEEPEFLPKFLHFAGWVNGLYGTLYVLVLNRISWVFPGVSNDVVPVPILGMPEFSAVILLGLISYEKNLKRIWPLLVLNAAVLLGMVIRAEWLAFAVGVVVWGACTRNLKRLAVCAAAVVFLIALMYVADVTISGPETRGGGSISAADIAARVIAPFDSDLAKQYSEETSDAQMYEGNAIWRTLWWASIWGSVHDSFGRALFGHGYGFPLGDLHPLLAGEFIRTPHNVLFYVLGYTGWIGVLLFAIFQIELGRLLWRVFRTTGEPYGIVFWVALLTFSVFTPFFEVPQGAIPFYLIVGCACAPMFREGGSMPGVAPEGIAIRGSGNSWKRKRSQIPAPSGTGVIG